MSCIFRDEEICKYSFHMLIFNLDKLKNGNAFVPCHFFKSDSVSKSEAAEMLIFLSFRRGWKQAQLGGIIALIFHNVTEKNKTASTHTGCPNKFWRKTFLKKINSSQN